MEPRINSNPIAPDYLKNRNVVAAVSWKAKGLKITRTRMVSDAGFPYWDISYCDGVLNGEDVEVLLPFHQIPKKTANHPMGFGKVFIINVAKKEGVYAKGTGIFESFSQTQG